MYGTKLTSLLYRKSPFSVKVPFAAEPESRLRQFPSRAGWNRSEPRRNAQRRAGRGAPGAGIMGPFSRWVLNRDSVPAPWTRELLMRGAPARLAKSSLASLCNCFETL